MLLLSFKADFLEAFKPLSLALVAGATLADRDLSLLKESVRNESE